MVFYTMINKIIANLLTKVITILILLLLMPTVVSIDPCDDFIETNDTTMTTAYTAQVDNFQCNRFKPFKWHRFTGTQEGYMTNTCPADLQCGSDIQIWFNDTVPTVYDGETFKLVCAHKGTSCCITKNMMKTKNCSDFVIFFLVPVPSCASYCFEAPQEEVFSSSSESSSSSSLQYLWIFLPVFALTILVLLFIVRKLVIRRNQLHQEVYQQALPCGVDNPRPKFNVNLLNRETF